MRRSFFVGRGPNSFPSTARLEGYAQRLRGFETYRFRHTAARMMLLNGANAYMVQQFLGHESMETTRIYTQMEQPDIERRHERASPVDRWGL